MSKYILEVEHLRTFFLTDQGLVKPVRDVSFKLEQGEILGIVGESGSGKSVTMYSVMGLLAKNGIIGNGRVMFDGKEILNVNLPANEVEVETLQKIKRDYQKSMQEVRGNEIAMIFQDPMSYLNPLFKIGFQMSEGLKRHYHFSDEECRKRNIEMLEMVGINQPDKRLEQYPHELSGGMRQRVLIATAMSSHPKLLIADEPTTALDVTIQAQILDLMKDLKEKTGMSIILITHDLGVVANMCTRIMIMYGGQLMESGTDREIFYEPRHPYTEGLLNSVANVEETAEDIKQDGGEYDVAPYADARPRLKPIEGSPPDLLAPPKGCAFVDRCEYAMKLCKENEPPRFKLSETHYCKCWLCHPDVEKIQKGE